jgi:integrase
MREKPFGLIRNLRILETRAEQFLKVLTTGTVSTNIFLRRLHNFALDMDWLPTRIIPNRQWPRIEFSDKRAITAEEQRKILANEKNPEWIAYYELLWHLGGSQSDIASLQAEDIDWSGRTISYCRLSKSRRTSAAQSRAHSK